MRGVDRMTYDEIKATQARLRELEKEATPGKWDYYWNGGCGHLRTDDEQSECHVHVHSGFLIHRTPPNMAFSSIVESNLALVVTLRNEALPALESALGLLEEQRELMKRFAEAIQRNALSSDHDFAACQFCDAYLEGDCVRGSRGSGEPEGEEMSNLTRAKIAGTEGGSLVIDKGNDGDVWVTVWDADPADLRSVPRSSIRICTRSGGGNAPNTRLALIALMEAIQKDGGEAHV